MYKKLGLSAVLIALAGCEAGSDTPGGVGSGAISVDAGKDIVVYSNTPTVITGKAISTNFPIGSMSWSGSDSLQVTNADCANKASSLNGSGFLNKETWTCGLNFVPPNVTKDTDYILTLTASEKDTDPSKATASMKPSSARDTVKVTVKPQIADNPFRVELGANFSVQGGDTINLSCNTDGGVFNDQNPIRYFWSQPETDSLYPLNILQSNTKDITLTAPNVKERVGYRFECTATDASGNRQNDSVQVIVEQKSNPSTANAGSLQKVGQDIIVNLNASGSTGGSDSSTLYYKWEQISGTPVQITNANGTNATFRSPKVNNESILRFRLSVKDHPIDSNTTFLGQEQQEVDVIVVPFVLISNAGNAQSLVVDTGTNSSVSIVLSAAGTAIPANNQIYYKWEQISGPETVSISNPYSREASFSIMTPTGGSWIGNYIFALYVSNTPNPSAYATTEVSTTTVTLSEKP